METMPAPGGPTLLLLESLADFNEGLAEFFGSSDKTDAVLKMLDCLPRMDNALRSLQ